MFKDTQVREGYPRPLSEWGMTTGAGAPVDRVDAAFVWAHNGKTYLFSGGEFWRFDESIGPSPAGTPQQGGVRPQEPGYPKDATLWRGVPAHVDDIISWGEGRAWPLDGWVQISSVCAYSCARLPEHPPELVRNTLSSHQVTSDTGDLLVV